MPARPERFFWLHGRALDRNTAVSVNEATNAFVANWTECPIDCTQSVLSDVACDRLWFFRVKTDDQRLATQFNRMLSTHIRSLAPLPLKRQVTLPTPLVMQPYTSGSQKLDLGLHVVNDAWNGSLMLFLYYEGRYYNPTHLQPKDLDDFRDAAQDRWTKAVCPCHAPHDHCTLGCWQCFDLDCRQCEGTGWINFTKWIQAGSRIDYSSRWPIAII